MKKGRSANCRFDEQSANYSASAVNLSNAEIEHACTVYLPQAVLMDGKVTTDKHRQTKGENVKSHDAARTLVVLGFFGVAKKNCDDSRAFSSCRRQIVGLTPHIAD